MQFQNKLEPNIHLFSERLLLAKVCQFSDKELDCDDYWMESSQFIHQVLHSVKYPEVLKDKNEDSHLLDCVFLHHVSIYHVTD